MDPLHQKLLSDLLEMRRVLMERTDALVQLLRTDTASKLNHMRNPTQTAYIGSSPDSFESVDVDSLLNAEAARQSPSQHKFQGGSLTGSPLTPLLRTITFQSSQPDIDQFMDLSPSQVQNDPKPSSNKPPAKVNSAVVTPITSMTPAAPLSAFYDEQPDIDALLNRAEGHLDQGVRWDATDYAADIAANKSTRISLFRNKTVKPGGAGGVGLFGRLMGRKDAEKMLAVEAEGHEPPITASVFDLVQSAHLSRAVSQGKVLGVKGNSIDEGDKRNSNGNRFSVGSRRDSRTEGMPESNGTGSKSLERNSLNANPLVSVRRENSRGAFFNKSIRSQTPSPYVQNAFSSSNVSISVATAEIHKPPSLLRHKVNTLERVTSESAKLLPDPSQLRHVVFSTPSVSPNAPAYYSQVPDMPKSEIVIPASESVASIERQTEKEIRDQFKTLDRILFYFLIPAFDNKGRPLNLYQFDPSDFEEVTFWENGVHPKSCFSTLWDFGMSIFYLIILWLVPFLASYGMHMNASFNLIATTIFTIVYIVDSVMASITPLPSNPSEMSSFREYETSRPALPDWFSSWLKFNLAVEVVSAIPFEVVFPDLQGLFLLRLLRYYRLPGMISRCAIYKRVKTRIESAMGSGVNEVIPLAVTIFFFFHFNACTMYTMGSIHGFEGWNQIWPLFEGSSFPFVYVWTFFQAVGNVFPMSFKPQTAIEQFIAIVFIIIGAVLYAVFIGAISSAAMSIDSSGRLYNQKIEQLIDYVRWKKLPEVTKQKLISYYETKYRGKYFEEESLLADMNDSLRSEIVHQNTRELIEKVPFLSRSANDGRDDIFFRRIAGFLHARYFIPGDFITKQGEYGKDMFFILSGKVHVYVNGKRAVALYDGAYIGEVALICRAMRTATVEAAMPSVLYRLTLEDFQSVLIEFPDMKAKIDKLAKDRERMLSVYNQ